MWRQLPKTCSPPNLSGSHIITGIVAKVLCFNSCLHRQTDRQTDRQADRDCKRHISSCTLSEVIAQIEKIKYTASQRSLLYQNAAGGYRNISVNKRDCRHWIRYMLYAAELIKSSSLHNNLHWTVVRQSQLTTDWSQILHTFWVTLYHKISDIYPSRTDFFQCHCR